MPAQTEAGKPRIDLSSYELSVEGRRIRLERQPLELLIFFVQRKGQLVTRQDIVDKLWGKDVFVDVDSGINAAVRKIRSALKDDPASPKYLETIVGKGYRFTGDVELVTHPIVDRAVPDNGLPHRGSWRAGRVGLLSVSLLLLLAIVGWAIVRWDRARRTLPESRRIHAIAVLPLSNFSGDPAQDYFADGMTDEITTDLAKISSLKVISRTSAMRYRAASKPLQQIARELNVDAVVEGSVLRSGNHVRITAQLIDALNDRHLWAETYDRDMQDVLALQNEVAIAIAENVRVQLTPQEQDLLASRKPLNPGAYDAYLKGRYYYDKRSDTSMRKAAGFFRQAIALDPEYAPAYSGLADVAVTQSHYQFEAPRDVLPEARAAALKAVELDDTSAEAHASLGNLYIEEWDWTKIGPEFERAIALNPGYANAHHWYSDYLSAVGRHDEALAAEKRALELDPLSPIINTWMGRRYYQARHYEQAYAAVHEALELDPDFEPGLVHLGLICVQLKRYDEAIAVLKRAVDSSQGGLLFVALLGYAEAMGGRQQAAEKILGGLTRESKQRYVPSYMIAQIYVALGDKDHAFYWLGRAYDERSDQMMYVRIDPPLDPIRSDPRFASLIRRVNLPQ